LIRAGILVLASSCSPSYQPLAELWLTSDASIGGVGGDNATGSGSGGAAGSGGTGGSATTTDGVTTSTGGAAGVGGSGGQAGAGGASGSGGSMGGGGRDGGGGKGGAGGAGGMQGTDAGSLGVCSLSVTVTTVTANGNYSPRNVGAIWIAKDSGTFIKTLALWARSRVSRLTLWNSTTAAAGLDANTVDAVTSATLSSHQTHKVSWNCADTKEMPVPDGPYRVYFEMTDRNGSGPTTFVSFAKGPMPLNLSPPDQPNFKGMSLVFTP
jgi:hypothetical protein